MPGGGDTARHKIGHNGLAREALLAEKTQASHQARVLHAVERLLTQVGVHQRRLIGDLEEGAGLLHPDEEPLLAEVVHLFVTKVTALPSLHDMGM